MTKKEIAHAAVDALKAEYPDAKCSLDYKTPLQLLIATRLSAQCTDARVNLVTPALFERFPDAESFAQAEVSEVAEYIKSKTDMKIRINTNGLVSLMHPTFDLYSMRGVIDSLSISLNASDPHKYLDITKSRFGLPSYNSMLNFAIVAHSFIPDVKFTIVDVIGEEEVEKCRERANDVGVPLRVRAFISNNREYD